MKLSAKDAAIQETIELIEKRFGKGTIMRGNQAPQNVDVIPTGCASLDTALGIGGYPKGKVIEIYGPESAGKSTLAIHAVAECQKLNEQVAYIDLENALDPVYAQNLGVDLDDILLSQPDCAEDAFEIIETLVRSGKISLIVLDSVAALATKAEIDGEMGDSQVASVPRLMSKALKKLIHLMTVNKCAVIYINQMRANIGGYGNAPTEKPSGGKALPYYASVRLDIRRIGPVKGAGDEIVGNQTRVKVAKNKLAPPLRQVEFDIIYGEGISKENDLIKLAVEKGILNKKGAWIEYNGKNIAQGNEKLRKLLKEDTDLYDEIAEVIKEVKTKVAQA